MVDSIPVLRRSWTCLGQPSGRGAQSPRESGAEAQSALYHATACSRGVDERDVVTALASSDQVCILSRSHDFSQALPFWQAFSASEETERAVTCVCVGADPAVNQTMVAASMDHRIAVWAASTSTSRKWRVHSTVMVNDGLVTSIDLHVGKLLIGTCSSISLWRLEQSSIGIWRRAWRKASPAPIRIARFSPDGSSIAAATEGGQNIVIWSLPSKAGQPPALVQRIFHPYPVLSLVWRQPPDRSSQSDVLVSHSKDGVARIWAAVIDEPARLRLWATLDPSSEAIRRSTGASAFVGPQPFYLEAHVVAGALRSNIGALERELQMMELGLGSDASQRDVHQVEMASDTKRTRLRRLQQLLSEAPDMFLKLEDDGFLTVLAVANIDRRPPTLLQTLAVLKVPICLPVNPSDVVDIALLPRFAGNDASSEDVFAVLQIRNLSGAMATIGVNPAHFFDGRGRGLSEHGVDLSSKAKQVLSSARVAVVAHHSRISKLHRSADGTFLTCSSSTETIIWRDTPPDANGGKKGADRIEPIAGPYDGYVRHTAISDDGLLHARLYGDQLQLHARSPFTVEAKDATWMEPLGEDVAVLQFTRIGAVQHLIACTKGGATLLWRIKLDSKLEASRTAGPQLPFQTPAIVAPVVGLQRETADAALVATITPEGLLDRWILRYTLSSAGLPEEVAAWQKETSVQTDVRGTVLISCASSGLNALVSILPDGKQRLSIYNSKASSFASGLEYERSYNAGDRIMAMDWSPSPLTGSILAIAFSHHVEILGPSRNADLVGDVADVSDYQWAPYFRVDMASCTPSKIRGLAWLTRDRIAVASASSIFVYGPTCDVAPAGKPMVATSSARAQHIAEVVAERMGPLPQYHPAFLQECLLWNNLDVARAIIVSLRNALSALSPASIEETWTFRDAPLESFSSVGLGSIGVPRNEPNGHVKPTTANGRSIFEEASDEDDDAIDEGLTAKNVEALLRSVEATEIPHLSHLDRKTLAVIIRAVSEAEEQRRSLDDNGLRFLMSLRLLLNRPANGELGSGSGFITGRLSYQETVWASHSDTQEPLLGAIASGCRNRLTWPMARSTGIFMWLKSHTTLREQAEQVARAQFMIGEDRDPVKCSLLYFALGKPKVVLGLWKQAVWHPEQKKMLQFLSKDFSEERWKTAAQKNAFALLSQRRYEFAASFFMLGDSLQDAVNVCVRNLNDLDLAVALARIREGNDDGPVLRNLLQTKVLPEAFEKGRRWLGTWAFWMLKRRDLAVRIIVSPLSELLADPDVATMLPAGTTCDKGHSDDASLAILFKQLKNKSLQTLKGSTAISERKEFEFVLHTNRVLCRTGCHLLGLNLLRTWEFEPPVVASSTTQYHTISKQDLATLSHVDSVLVDESKDSFVNALASSAAATASRGDALKKRDSYTSMSPPSSPTMARRRSSMLRRRSSILNDLNIGSPHGTQTHQHLHQHEQSTSDASDAPRREPSVAPAGTSTIFQRYPSGSAPNEGHDATAAAAATIIEEPSSTLTEPGEAKTDEVQETTALEASQTKPKGLGVFKAAAASNANQGAQEFDFGSFGF